MVGELVKDADAHRLLTYPELFFNAGRLDRSVALVTEDYLRIASPRIKPITIPSS